MRFGKLIQLQRFEEWKDSYINYKRLKRFINRLGDDIKKGGSLDEASQTFFDMLDQEIGVICDFLEAKLKEVRTRLVIVAPELKDRVSVHSSSASSSVSSSASASSSASLEAPSITHHEVEDGEEESVSTHSLSPPNNHSHTHNQHEVEAKAAIFNGDAFQKEDEIMNLYIMLIKLESYFDINRTGFRKILKKFDKHTKQDSEEALKKYSAKLDAAIGGADENHIRKYLHFVKVVYINQVLVHGFLVPLQKSEGIGWVDCLKSGLKPKKNHGLTLMVSPQGSINNDTHRLPLLHHDQLEEIDEKLLLSNATTEDETKANAIKKAALDRLDTVKTEVLTFSTNPAHKVKWHILLLAAILALIIFLIPVFPSEPRAHRCLVLLVVATLLWVTEAVPFFLTSLAIPVIAVLSSVYTSEDDDGTTASAKDAASAAFSHMFNDTVFLVFGGFTLSLAFCQCGFELKMASWIQQRFGYNPRYFLLSFMVMGFFLSMWISNVAAPVLCTTVITPILSEFSVGLQRKYSKALLIGLAFACNLGGMLSPVSSPQNSVAMGYLEDNYPDDTINFLDFLAVSVPFSTVALLCVWTYISYFYLREDFGVQHIPPIVCEESQFSAKDKFVLLVALITIALWCTLTWTVSFFGNMGLVAVLPALIFFATGVLTKDSLAQYPWSLILLIGGGSVLGNAVESSKLLDIITDDINPYIDGFSAWTTVIIVVSIVFFIATFVSHTVSAIIMMPFVCDIAVNGGFDVRVMAMCATLCMSAPMSLPTSSFPNVNSIMVEDDVGQTFIGAVHYLKHGTACAFIILGLLCTLSYGLSVGVLA